MLVFEYEMNDNLNILNGVIDDKLHYRNKLNVKNAKT